MGAALSFCFGEEEYEQILLRNKTFSYGNKKKLYHNDGIEDLDVFGEVLSKHHDLSLKYHNNDIFRKNINPRLKIILTIEKLEDVYMNKLNLVHTLRIFDVKRILNINENSRINTIILETNLFDNAKRLGFVKTLIIWSNSMKYLDTLDKVHTLDITGCKKVKNIDMLHNVHTLCMNDCPKIKDVGNLKRLRVLFISDFVNGVHLLNNLRELYIPFFLLINNKTMKMIKKLIFNNKEVKIITYVELKKYFGKNTGMYNFTANQGVFDGYMEIDHNRITNNKRLQFIQMELVAEVQSMAHLQSDYLTLIKYKNYPYKKMNIKQQFI
jgi:hypothetical protein